MAGIVENVNVAILRQCREQMALAIEDVHKKVGSIEAIEAGIKYPTFRQLETLARLYNVPRWVFISEKLPPKYSFAENVPAFRQFSEQTTGAFSNSKVRGLVMQIGRLRELVIELREDMDEPIEPFLPPTRQNGSIGEIAKTIRSWLDVQGNPEFPEWKSRLEQKGIFVFMTGKYQGWSHIDREIFRGLSMYYPVLPVIIINDSDAKQAQSFTLFHELGHLIRREHAVDSWSEQNKETEKWCDRFAGEVLMPAVPFWEKIGHDKMDNLQSVKKLARTFRVSPYACLVRLRHLQVINQDDYLSFEDDLKQEYKDIQIKLKEKSGGPSRDRVREVLNQYGHIYTRTLFQAYSNKAISLHKLSKALNLKHASQVLELADRL